MRSFGLTGESWGKGKTRVANNNFAMFDSSETVARTIDQGANLFSHIVLSTWIGEDKDLSKLEKNNTSVVLLDDPGGDPGKTSESSKDVLDTRLNNKRRQFRGLEGALETFSEGDFEYVIKIRTDQELNLEMLALEFHNWINLGQSGFFIPYYHREVPWAIPDFYFGSDFSSMTKLSSLMQSKFEFSLNIHRDMFFKGILAFDPSLIFDNSSSWFPYDDLAISKDLINRGLQYWHAGSIELLSTTKWRGKEIGSKKFTSSLIPDTKTWITNTQARDMKLLFKSLSFSGPLDFKLALVVFFFAKMQSRARKLKWSTVGIINQRQRK